MCVCVCVCWCRDPVTLRNAPTFICIWWSPWHASPASCGEQAAGTRMGWPRPRPAHVRSPHHPWSPCTCRRAREHSSVNIDSEPTRACRSIWCSVLMGWVANTHACGIGAVSSALQAADHAVTACVVSVRPGRGGGGGATTWYACTTSTRSTPPPQHMPMRRQRRSVSVCARARVRLSRVRVVGWCWWVGVWAPRACFTRQARPLAAASPAAAT